MLSFCCIDFPKSDSTSLIQISKLNFIPKKEIATALSFFKRSTYVFNGKTVYDHYLNMLEQLFTYLYEVDTEHFTALYKMEIPIEKEFKDIAVAFRNCIESDHNNHKWCDNIAVDIEWLSAGEYQHAVLFGGFYQRLNEFGEDYRSQNLILLFDEPEMHMHPEIGRNFIKNIEKTLSVFRSRGLINSCQIIFATHSPFIIQDISKFQSSISLIDKKDNQISIKNFSSMRELTLPDRDGYSFNLVMYHIFGVPTVELHIELYAFLQNKDNQPMNIMDCDRYIAKQTHFYDVTKHAKEWKYGRFIYQTLPSFIRNAIDHPQPNDLKKQYTPEELACSIELLIKLCNDTNPL